MQHLFFYFHYFPTQLRWIYFRFLQLSILFLFLCCKRIWLRVKFILGVHKWSLSCQNLFKLVYCKCNTCHVFLFFGFVYLWFNFHFTLYLCFFLNQIVTLFSINFKFLMASDCSIVILGLIFIKNIIIMPNLKKQKTLMQWSPKNMI